MTDSVQLSIEQFTDAWRLMCGASARRASASLDGLELVFSGLPVAFFNVGLATGRGLSSAALAACGRRACDWAAGHGVPWLFVTTKETLADGVDAAAALDPVGLAPLMPLTGMLAPGVGPAPRVIDGLRLTTPGDEAACAAMIAVNSKAYGMDLEAASQIVANPAFWRPQFPVVAIKDGVPVACAAVMMVNGHRYVALVATDPAQQRRGYADASMRRALEAAAAVHGDSPTVLHATEAGRPMYERMGYRVLANHAIFMEKRFLTEH
jgi:GNAT superfamily N-acetyltransferase